MESELSVLAGMVSWCIKLGLLMIGGRGEFSGKLSRCVSFTSDRSSNRSSDLQCRNAGELIFEVLASSMRRKNKVLFNRQDCQKKKKRDDQYSKAWPFGSEGNEGKI